MNNATMERMWTMFQNLEDLDNDELVDTCVYFIKHFGFDKEVLPETLYWRVNQVLDKEKRDSYWEDVAHDSMIELIYG